MKGKVVLFNCFLSDIENNIVEMNKLQEKYYDKGFWVVGFMPLDKLLKPVIAEEILKFQPKFKILKPIDVNG